MADLVIGNQMGMATLESCAEADALAPGVASVVPVAKRDAEARAEVINRIGTEKLMRHLGFSYREINKEWVASRTGEVISDELVRLLGIDGITARVRGVTPGGGGGSGSVQMILLANQGQQTVSAFYANQFVRPNLPIPQVDDKMLGEMEKLMAKSGRKEPERAKSVNPRRRPA